VIFLDTNILIYAHLWVEGDPRCLRADALLAQPVAYVLSTQVLAEYSVRMIRQGIADAAIVDNVEALARRFEVRPVTALTVQTAWGLRQRYGYAYWDAQIVAAALEAGCTRLFTEDLQDGQQIEGRLQLINPLR
jgi:predicted nucleic acid-binding protein